MTLPILVLLAAAVTAWACYEPGKRRERDRWHARVDAELERMRPPVEHWASGATVYCHDNEYPAVSRRSPKAANVVTLRGRGL
jgi:hypothetical protein